ncbi:MAG: AAA family ATPase, partial [candidate division WOR-3 bacterium]
MRPSTLDGIVGQEHLLGRGKSFRRMLERGELHSMILWGPPGSGKTTLARVIAGYVCADFVQVSAVTSG